MRKAKIQISLRIRAVWSESSLGAFWIDKDVDKFLHADNEDSDQTVQADLSSLGGRQMVRFLTLRMIKSGTVLSVPVVTDSEEKHYFFRDAADLFRLNSQSKKS